MKKQTTRKQTVKKKMKTTNFEELVNDVNDIYDMVERNASKSHHNHLIACRGDRTEADRHFYSGRTFTCEMMLIDLRSIKIDNKTIINEKPKNNTP